MLAAADRALVEALVQRSPSGILVTDPEGKIRIVNESLAQMIPLVPDPIGRLPIQGMPIESLADALDPERDDELEFTHRSGNKDLFIRVVPLSSNAPDAEELKGARLAIVEDITRLRKEEKYRREFVANVSHEMRTPATSIAGYAETLLEEREALDGWVVDMVEVIFRNAKRLTDIFEDLLVLARIEAAEGKLPLEPLPLLPRVNEAIDRMKSLADDKQVQFQSFVTSDLRVQANREALGHVIGNLVSNAVKYSYQGGVVTVRAQARDEGILLEVIDLGIGIEPRHHDRVFERFLRVDKGRARMAGGTGLGLAIVKRMVHAMGGAIDVRSRPEKGSVFRVLLRPATPVLN